MGRVWGRDTACPSPGQDTLIMVSRPETLGTAAPGGSASSAVPGRAAVMYWPPRQFSLIWGQQGGPRRLLFRIQPWLLLKTQAQRLPVAPSQLCPRQTQPSHCQNASRAGAKEPQPETKAVTSHTQPQLFHPQACPLGVTLAPSTQLNPGLPQEVSLLSSFPDRAPSLQSASGERTSDQLPSSAPPSGCHSATLFPQAPSSAPTGKTPFLTNSNPSVALPFLPRPAHWG